MKTDSSQCSSTYAECGARCPLRVSCQWAFVRRKAGERCGEPVGGNICIRCVNTVVDILWVSVLGGGGDSGVVKTEKMNRVAVADEVYLAAASFGGCCGVVDVGGGMLPYVAVRVVHAQGCIAHCREPIFKVNHRKERKKKQPHKYSGHFYVVQGGMKNQTNLNTSPKNDQKPKKKL